MSLTLQPLRFASLSNMEAGQLINRHLTDVGSIDPGLRTDEPFNTYVQKLTAQSTTYEKALAQVQTHEETLKISHADDDRDKASRALELCVKLYLMSDDEAEAEAARGLKIILQNFKGLSALNYEAETMAIDKLVDELGKPANSPKVELLNMESYVTRLTTKNEAFKAHFNSRIQSEAHAEAYDMKVVRKETYQIYKEFCSYVLAMAKALKTPLFIQALDLLNAGRSYYANMLARQGSGEHEPQQPT
jgi:hypothetical protein